MNEWIPVKERMPYLNTKWGESAYLLCWDGSQEFVGFYSKGRGWIIAHFLAESRPLEVTHWMRLPELPKNETKV